MASPRAVACARGGSTSPSSGAGVATTASCSSSSPAPAVAPGPGSASRSPGRSARPWSETGSRGWSGRSSGSTRSTSLPDAIWSLWPRPRRHGRAIRRCSTISWAFAVGYVMARLLLVSLFCYRKLISPLLLPACRFEPTCSVYAETVLRRHGLLSGLYLSVRRLLRCHPFHPGGYDPPPL